YQPGSWPSTAEGEARQADEIVRHYRSLVEHPAVQSITYWGITDAGAWLGAPPDCCASTARTSPPMTRCATSCAASGGCRPPEPARTTTASFVCRASSATTA